MIRIYFWRIPSSRILWAILHMALDRIPLKRNSSISFWKLLGTGKGETFTPRDADPRRWGLLVVIDPGALEEFENTFIAHWRKFALDEFSATLQTISSHGSWSGKTPFHLTESINSHNNEVVAITRARKPLGPSSIVENDLARRNAIINLLEEWGLIKVVNPDFIKDPRAPLSQIKIIAHKDKSEWQLVAKYNIGKKKKED